MSRTRKRAIPAMLIALGVVVVLAVGLAIWMSIEIDNRSSETPVEQPSPVPTATATPEASGVRALPAGEQQALATTAALGKDGQSFGEKNGDRTITRPAKLFWNGDRAILITSMQIEDGCHGCSGALGVYYLAPKGDDAFAVTGKWPEAIDGSSWGAPPANWRVSNKFTDDPVIYATGGGTWQGYTCSVATLTRLADTGPKTMVSIPLSYDNSGSVMADTKVRLHGTIANILKNKSFDVRYTGTETFTDHYMRQGDQYVVEGKARMQSC
ncbi:hypothetical protein [Stakelama marina]|uniref:Lipoprotein n=1 Tax=Stakelama marina TaxID=2826939 RepID=A0A8T4IHI1_9SPHN|nr:hypothetical protein [Stakelama marina]MBR0551676.1 hypothetical protein [Stakelama marina]